MSVSGSVGKAGAASAMQRIILASDGLPDHLDDQARFSLWRDLYTAHYGALEIFRPHDRSLSMQWKFERWGPIGLGQLERTFNRVTRTRGTIAADASDEFCLVLNRSRTRMSTLHRGREAVLDPEAATLDSDTEVAGVRGAGENAIFAIVLRRGELLSRAAGRGRHDQFRIGEIALRLQRDSLFQPLLPSPLRCFAEAVPEQPHRIGFLSSRSAV